MGVAFCLFDLIFYVPVNNLSVTSGWVFMCIAQGHNAVTPVRLEPTALWSTTEPLCSHIGVAAIFVK